MVQISIGMIHGTFLAWGAGWGHVRAFCICAWHIPLHESPGKLTRILSPINVAILQRMREYDTKESDGFAVILLRLASTETSTIELMYKSC